MGSRVYLACFFLRVLNIFFFYSSLLCVFVGFYFFYGLYARENQFRFCFPLTFHSRFCARFNSFFYCHNIYLVYFWCVFCFVNVLYIFSVVPVHFVAMFVWRPRTNILYEFTQNSGRLKLHLQWNDTRVITCIFRASKIYLYALSSINQRANLNVCNSANLNS